MKIMFNIVLFLFSGVVLAQEPAITYSYNQAIDGYSEHHIRVMHNGKDIAVSPRGGSAWNATFMPDGGILFSYCKDDECQIYRVQRDGSELTQLTSETGLIAFHPITSRDGKWIVFTWYNRKAIGLMNADGSELKIVAPFDGYDYHPVFFSDNKRILFGSKRSIGANGEPGIFVYHMETQEVTPTGFYGYYARPSNDGQKIVFGGNETKGQKEPDIYIATLGQPDSLTQLTNNHFYEGHPTFSTNDDRILYVSRRFQAPDFPPKQESDTSGTNEVVSMKLDGSDVKRHTFGGAVAWHPEYDLYSVTFSKR